MEQKPFDGPGNRPERTHTYRAGGDEQDIEAARAALRRARRKKQVRRNRIIGLLVLLVLLTLIILGIVGAVRFFTRDKEEVSSVASAVSAVSAPEEEDGAAPQSGVAAVAPPQPEENPGDYTYYEKDVPLLLNKYNPLPDDMMGDFAMVDMEDAPTTLNEPEVVQVGLRPDTGEMHYLQGPAAKAFLDMVEAAAEDGINLYPVSGYRSHTRQVSNFEARVGEYVGQGYSRDQAEALTSQLIAVPGTSEHEAGLAIDINSLDQSFERTEAFTWLSENCNRFGFILRYEKATFAETGIDYEPWHYRYVGENHAYAITELGLTLEGYVAHLGGEVKTATGTLAPPEVGGSGASGSASTATGTASGGAGSEANATSGDDSEIPMG